MKPQFKKMNKYLLTLLVICTISINSEAQIQLFPIEKLTQEYLEVQNNKVPIFNSTQYSTICLFDNDWCNSSDPELSPPSPYPITQYMDPKLLLALIDSQLVLVPKSKLSFDNGPIIMSSNFISNGFFMLPISNGLGKLGFNANFKNIVFRHNGFMESETLFDLKLFNIKSVALNRVSDKFIVHATTEYLDPSDQDDDYQQAIDQVENYFADTNESGTLVIIDGILTRIQPGILLGLFRDGIIRLKDQKFPWEPMWP